MSGSGGLPPGAFITTLDNRRCTAIPRANNNGGNNRVGTTTTTADLKTTVVDVIQSTSVAPPPPSPTSSAPPSPTLAPPAVTTSAAVSIPLPSTFTTSQILQPVLAAPVPPIQDEPESTSPAAQPAATTSSAAQTSEAASTNPAAPSTTEAAATSQQPQQTALPMSENTSSSAESAATTTAGDEVMNSIPGAGGAAIISNTIAAGNPATSNVSGISESANNPMNSPPVTAESATNGGQTSTAAIAGGVTGAIAAIAIVAFLVWFWRRRILRKRRSTLLTPLSPDPNYMGGDNEKGGNPYTFNRGSIGPTPRSERFKASLGAGARKVKTGLGAFWVRRGSTGGQSRVNMDRGNSQFMEDAVTISRSSSPMRGDDKPSAKERLQDFWSNLASKWRARSGSSSFSGPDTETFSNEKPRNLGSNANTNTNNGQPDFLTLMNMDDRQLEREAQRRRVSRANGSSSSADHFLGGLNLNFDMVSGPNAGNPFSDSAAIPNNAPAPPPMTASGPNNPFTDAAAVPGQPATYVADMRRSRAPSVSRGRESVASEASFQTRRNKFRSDPFDLEPLGRVSPMPGAPPRTSSNFSTAGSSAPRLSEVSALSDNRGSVGVGVGGPRKPVAAKKRADSFSSKYSSGVSMGEWSDPGPDVGPAATRAWDAASVSSMGSEEGVVRGGKGGGSMRSVGKAM